MTPDTPHHERHTGPGPAVREEDRSDHASLVAELVERFALADRRGAVARTRQLRGAGVADDELRDVVGAAVRHVGELWQAGRWTITQEHAATAIAEAVLSSIEVDAPLDQPVGTVAVVAAEGEWHAFPARLFSHALESAGLEVRYLGAGVPAEDVARTLPAAGAGVLAVSITLTSNLVGAARTIAAGRAAGLPVILGGAASSTSRAAALGADAYASDVTEGAAIARRWCLEGPPKPAQPTIDPRAVAAFTAQRDRLRDAAYGATAERWPALSDASDELIDRTCEDLELHLDHLAAAVLVGEHDAYRDLVDWLGAVHAGRGLPPEALAAELDALHAVLTDEPVLAAIVDAARPPAT